MCKGQLTAEFGVLGAVEARIGGRAVDLGHARQRYVLGVLLIEAGRPVPADQLIDRVWGEGTPQRVAGTLYSYLSRLRSALADAPSCVVDQLDCRAFGYDQRQEYAFVCNARVDGE